MKHRAYNRNRNVKKAKPVKVVEIATATTPRCAIGNMLNVAAGYPLVIIYRQTSDEGGYNSPF